MAKELTGDYRKFMDKNYLGAWDVPDEGDLILTIDRAARDDVKNERGTERKLTLQDKTPASFRIPFSILAAQCAHSRSSIL